MGRRIYVTVNTVFQEREADRMYQLLQYLDSVKPDALIVQDFGVLEMARQCFPALKLHASTQMNIASAKGVNLLSKHGVSRVVLARELSLDEIAAIKQSTNAELEVFVHGAICVSASGLCLFSSYLGGKSANRGMCTQACRRLYTEGDRRGYYFSPFDMQLLERIPELAAAGVCAFKIEGRMKSADYVRQVVRAYRLVLDALSNSVGVNEAIDDGRRLLAGDFARRKSLYRIDSSYPPPETYLDSSQDGGTGVNLGVIQRIKGGSGARMVLLSGGVGGGCATGDSIRLHRADDSGRRTHKVACVEAEEAEGAEGGAVWVSAPDGFDVGDSVYLVQRKTRNKRYPHVVPAKLDRCNKRPGHDEAPAVERLLPDKEALQAFPEGVYAAFSDIAGLFIAQSMKTDGIILEYTDANVPALLAGKATASQKEALPFPRKDIILSLNPFFPQEAEKRLEAEAPLLLERGFRRFIVNNPGQIAFFRGRKDVFLAAGPYLYTFNRWAAAWVNGLGLGVGITPYENNRQNLEKTWQAGERRRVFVTVFAWPKLFRMRGNLAAFYGFDGFSGAEGEEFTLLGEGDASYVIPNKAFSITDKVQFLREAGFRRFIADFSGPNLTKQAYKSVMSAIKTGAPLPGISRFNWKDGFYGTKPAGS
jgi:putative protease